MVYIVIIHETKRVYLLHVATHLLVMRVSKIKLSSKLSNKKNNMNAERIQEYHVRREMQFDNAELQHCAKSNMEKIFFKSLLYIY